MFPTMSNPRIFMISQCFLGNLGNLRCRSPGYAQAQTSVKVLRLIFATLVPVVSCEDSCVCMSRALVKVVAAQRRNDSQNSRGQPERSKRHQHSGENPKLLRKQNNKQAKSKLKESYKQAKSKLKEG